MPIDHFLIDFAWVAFSVLSKSLQFLTVVQVVQVVQVLQVLHNPQVNLKKTQLFLSRCCYVNVYFMTNTFAYILSKYSIFRDLEFKKNIFSFSFSNLATTEQTTYSLLVFSHVYSILVRFRCFFMALMPTRWNRDSSNPAHVVLEKLFQDGSIDGTTKPKTIYDAHEIFKTFPLAVFRNVFNEFKSLTGLLCKFLPCIFF